nr:hypothetical protein CFP56_01077 [Quercus suber]
MPGALVLVGKLNWGQVQTSGTVGPDNTTHGTQAPHGTDAVIFQTTQHCTALHCTALSPAGTSWRCSHAPGGSHGDRTGLDVCMLRYPGCASPASIGALGPAVGDSMHILHARFGDVCTPRAPLVELWFSRGLGAVRVCCRASRSVQQDSVDTSDKCNARPTTPPQRCKRAPWDDVSLWRRGDYSPLAWNRSAAKMDPGSFTRDGCCIYCCIAAASATGGVAARPAGHVISDIINSRPYSPSPVLGHLRLLRKISPYRRRTSTAQMTP